MYLLFERRHMDHMVSCTKKEWSHAQEQALKMYNAEQMPVSRFATYNTLLSATTFCTHPWHLCTHPWHLCTHPWHLCTHPWHLCTHPYGTFALTHGTFALTHGTFALTHGKCFVRMPLDGIDALLDLVCTMAIWHDSFGGGIHAILVRPNPFVNSKCIKMY